MDYRIGICSSCRANFKIPASFTPTQARCRSCSGVVEIGPVQSNERQFAPAPPRAQRPNAARDVGARAPARDAETPARTRTNAPSNAPAANGPVASPKQAFTPRVTEAAAHGAARAAERPAPETAQAAQAKPQESAAPRSAPAASAAAATPATAHARSAQTNATRPAATHERTQPKRKRKLVPLLTVLIVLVVIGVGVWMVIGASRPTLVRASGEQATEGASTLEQEPTAPEHEH